MRVPDAVQKLANQLLATSFSHELECFLWNPSQWLATFCWRGGFSKEHHPPCAMLFRADRRKCAVAVLWLQKLNETERGSSKLSHELRWLISSVDLWKPKCLMELSATERFAKNTGFLVLQKMKGMGNAPTNDVEGEKIYWKTPEHVRQFCSDMILSLVVVFSPVTFHKGNYGI